MSIEIGLLNMMPNRTVIFCLCRNADCVATYHNSFRLFYGPKFSTFRTEKTNTAGVHSVQLRHQTQWTQIFLYSSQVMWYWTFVLDCSKSWYRLTKH